MEKVCVTCTPHPVFPSNAFVRTNVDVTYLAKKKNKECWCHISILIYVINPRSIFKKEEEEEINENLS